LLRGVRTEIRPLEIDLKTIRFVRESPIGSIGNPWLDQHDRTRLKAVAPDFKSMTSLVAKVVIEIFGPAHRRSQRGGFIRLHDVPTHILNLKARVKIWTAIAGELDRP
jgi:hypothetical protein